MINIKKNNINLKEFLDKIYNINSIISLNEQIVNNNNIYELFTIIRIINLFFIEYYDEVINNKKIYYNVIKHFFKKYYNCDIDFIQNNIYELLNIKIIDNNYKIINDVQKLYDKYKSL